MKANSVSEGVNFDDQDRNETWRISGSKKAPDVANEIFTNSTRHSDPDPGPGKEGEGGPQNRKTSSIVEKSIARICGSSRSKCGYCGGNRLHVLGIKDSWNEIVAIGAATKHEDSGEDESIRAENEKNKAEAVDGTKTSKSYGLLFDHLPNGTYEDLINLGWRRSGKHLYRPHNFESCCPAISIRLNVLNFASSQSSDAYTSRVAGSDLAKAILVRGSKSQRKVGKAVLRALESYNSKFGNTRVGLSSDDSIHTSNVAKMQIDGSMCDFAGSGCSDKENSLSQDNQNEGRCNSEPKHQHKKSRKRAPDRVYDQLDDVSLVRTQEQGYPPAALKTNASKSDGTNRESPETCQDSLVHVLRKLERVIYHTITNEGMKSVASNCQGGTSGNVYRIQKPEWAWWDKNVPDAETTVPKWCSFKVSKSQQAPKDQRNTNKSGVSVIVSTSACAAAAGRSRGGVDKNVLVRAVVDSLRRFIRDNSQQNKNYQATEVLFHERSGHVHVALHCHPSAGVALAKPSKHDSVLEKGNCAPIQRCCAQSVDEVDPITHFIARNKAIASKIHQPNTFQNESPYQQRMLTIRSVPVHESSLQPEVHQLFCRYQTAVHGDFDPFFGVDKLSKEKDDDRDYTYYRQTNPLGFLDVDAAYSHLDDARRSKIKTSYLSFYRFLCETPMVQCKVPSIASLPSEDGYDIHIPFGTYHQQYRLSTSKDAFDGPLVAVGVADILPHCFSSVYAFYDPILSHRLKLGKYTALREIEWVRRASQFRPDLHYYYLGYYIHSCQKMTYKAEYGPSELLCPVNMEWVDFEDGKKRLEECSPIRHCCALFPNPPLLEQEPLVAKPKFKIEDITLDIGENEPHLVQVGRLNRQGREFIDPHVNEFVSEVGIDMCSKFVIKLR